MENLINISKQQIESYLENYFNTSDIDIDDNKIITKLLQNLKEEISIEIVFHKEKPTNYNLKVGLRTYTVKEHHSDYPFALCLTRYLLDKTKSHGLRH